MTIVTNCPFQRLIDFCDKQIGLSFLPDVSAKYKEFKTLLEEEQKLIFNELTDECKPIPDTPVLVIEQTQYDRNVRLAYLSSYMTGLPVHASFYDTSSARGLMGRVTYWMYPPNLPDVKK